METKEEIIAHIKESSMLQMSDVLIQAVNSIQGIIDNHIFNRSSIPQNILLLIGSTRAGKSTTFSYLSGNNMKKETVDFQVVFSTENNNNDDRDDIIGHDLEKSKTFYPNVN